MPRDAFIMDIKTLAYFAIDETDSSNFRQINGLFPNCLRVEEILLWTILTFSLKGCMCTEQVY